MDRTDPAYRGQSDYSRLLLRLYDPLVLGPVARYVWRCPTPRLVDTYRLHIRRPHLDVGPGTGFFLRHSGLPRGSQVTIVDPNPNVLQHSVRHLPALDVKAVEGDVLKQLDVGGPFQSAALNLVLHCLPGPTERKARAVANVAATLAPDGVLFGATVLGRSGRHTWLGRRVLGRFNHRGAFDNMDDTEEGLAQLLGSSFGRVDIQTVGSIAIFVAADPSRGPQQGSGRAAK